MPKLQLVQFKSRQRGSVFLESLLSVFILGLGASAFFSLMPTMSRAKTVSSNASKALQICNRMIEHVQLLKADDVTATALTQLNLIDANQTASPYSFTIVPLDDASKYSPAQMLRNGTGTMTVTELASGSRRIILTVSWTTESGKAASVTTGTIIGAYR